MSTALRYVPLLATLVSTGCGAGEPGAPTADLGLAAGYTATTVVAGLMNPSGLSFGPGGQLTICDSGHGRVLAWKDGVASDWITGFTTEYWKPGKDGAPDRFKLGPLSAVWLGDSLVVSDAGKKDGAETLLFFTGKGTAADGVATNPVPPTSKDPADKGEGNLTGLAAAQDGDTIWVCGQGADAKTWLLRAALSTKELEPFASADANGIATNSPMQAIDAGEHVLVLYSGKGGVEDGLIVEWDVATKKPVAQWKLPGLIDPMGMARAPGSDELAVVDNNWSLTKVNPGKLARVTLPAGGGEAKVTVIGTKLLGPVSCTFGADRSLYVALLGESFDGDKGSIVRITGF